MQDYGRCTLFLLSLSDEGFLRVSFCRLVSTSLANKSCDRWGYFQMRRLQNLVFFRRRREVQLY